MTTKRKRPKNIWKNNNWELSKFDENIILINGWHLSKLNKINSKISTPMNKLLKAKERKCWKQQENCDSSYASAL